MENEVSGIAKLGIVLIALAVLIGLGFGIFQISKSTANSGVNDVQSELDGVATSQFTTYDQTTITGTMVGSALSDFEGENVAVLVATQAWVNALGDTDSVTGAADGAGQAVAAKGSGFVIFNTDKNETSTVNAEELPVVWAYTNSELDDGSDNGYKMVTAKGETVDTGSFINYNALLGNVSDVQGTTAQQVTLNGTDYYMGGVYFDVNCFRTPVGFMTDASGRVLFNNIVGNTNKTGRTEYIPSGGKFNSFLVKDASGTTMGVAFQQLNNG